ncbi:MAG: hypothetical protein WCF14_03550 [Nitrososphaeraceae archaeon]
MSSKNLNKKSDDKNDKAEQQALKEVEIVAELAPNEKTRKEAEELIETVESASSSTVQEQEQEAIETVLDETKRAIKKTVNEAKREIPKYIKAIGDLQEGTIQATKEIPTSKGSNIFSSTASGKIYVILCTVDVSDDSDGVLQQNGRQFRG